MIRVKRLLKSFVYAFRGLFKTFKEEQNLQIQSFIGFIVIVTAYIFKVTAIEWSILLFAICLVILMEVVNSAVERVTDVLKPRINEYVKEIKDVMAAAVMLSSLLAFIIGIIIFWPYIFTA